MDSARQVVCDHLTKIYGKSQTKALDSLSFSLHSRGIFVLIGRNGSGKTTLVRILATELEPTSGTATINGIDVLKESRRLRETIAIVPQEARPIPWMTPMQTVLSYLLWRGFTYGEAMQRGLGALEKVGLSDKSNVLNRSLSGGMRRKVMIATVLASEAEVIFLDEPTTGLDPGARRDLWQYLGILRDQERVSIIVTTHLMEEAERCDRLAILSEGSLVALGTPESLTREIGGDVILLEARDPQLLADQIRNRFHVDATVMDQQVRLEIENGHRFVPDVVEAFPGEIQSLSVSKPTLEDVFIHRTGHRFWNEGAEPEVGAEKEKKGRKKH